MRFVSAFVLALSPLALLLACDRERVDVGDIDGGGGGEPTEVDGQQTIVPQVDGGFDVVLVTCGNPPIIGKCPPCPNGYATDPDGEATCDCCP